MAKRNYTRSEMASSNRSFATRAEFQHACADAQIPPTKRQAAKFRQGRGKAFGLASERVRRKLAA